MIIRQFLKSISYLLLTLSFTPAHSQENIVGLWGFDGCENAEKIEYQGYSLAAFIRDNAVEIILQEITPIDGSSWFFVRTDQLDPAPSLARVKDGFLGRVDKRDSQVG